MAKTSKSVSFKNATIDTKSMTITEYTKDDSYEYDLMTVLEAWNGVDGVALSIRQDSELSTQGGGDS